MAPAALSGTSSIPNRIGPYEVIEEIALGATAAVYRGRGKEGEVALKVLLPHLAADAVVRERFRREVAIVRNLRHPNIVPVYDLVTDRERLAIVMAYCPGGNLEAWHPEGEAEVIETTAAICRALAHAHRKGIIHRDLKPQNLLRDAAGKVLLCDFGSARFQGVVGLTTTSMVVGTPEYIAPELVRGFPPEPRSDLFSLGVLLYRALCGRLPFSGFSRLFGEREASPPDPRKDRPDLSPWLAELIVRLLGPIEDRPPTAEAVSSILARKAVPERPSMKRCLFCNEPMPETFTICFSCGERDIVFDPAGGGDYRIILRKIPEEMEVMERFTAVVRNLSGNPEKELDILTGDIRLYSKEERRRGRRLPTPLIEGIGIEPAARLNALLRKIGVVTHVERRRPRWLRRSSKSMTPVIERIHRATFSLPSEALQQRLGGRVMATRTPNLKEILVSVIRAVDRLSLHFPPEKESRRDHFDELTRTLHIVISEIEEMSAFLAGVRLGEVYGRIKRLERRIEEETDPDTLETLIAERKREEGLFEKFRRIEIERSRLLALLLRTERRFAELAEKAEASSHCAVEETGEEFSRILMELEAELDDDTNRSEDDVAISKGTR
ncbi:MAG: serine/threonine protein kinase [Deltaproteobacteria bacterium]|nr:MAG: serine/threonine protein kinase [Deltaproteobacteria bacterium]